jgi:tetratricopeptide (TPR) repeat protein
MDDYSIPSQKSLKDAKILEIGFRHIPSLSFVLNNSLGWGLAGFHLVNVFLHMLNVILVYYLFHLTVRLPSQQHSIEGTSRLIPLFVAALFALHPIQTSAVTYIIQRATVLATLFCLCSLIFYLKGVLSSNKILSFVVLYPLSLVFLLFGLISKEQAILFPVIILLYDLFFISAFRWKNLISRLIPIVSIFVFISFIAVVRFNAIETLKDIASIFVHINTPIPSKGWTAVDVFWTPLQHILTEFGVVSRYLTLFLLPLPSRMVFDFGPSYPLSAGLFSPLTTLFSLLFLIGLIMLSVSYAKRHPLFSFGILFYLILISLESFVAVGSDLYFEHRNYSPGIGIFLSISYIAVLLLQKFKLHKMWCLFILIPLSLSYLTYERNFAWQSEESLWQDTIQKAPSNKRALASLGYVYTEKGRYTQALDILKKSIDIPAPRKSLDFIAYSNLLELYFHLEMKKEMLETITLLEKLSSNRLDISHEMFLFFAGNAYFWYGDMEKSAGYLRRALPLIHDIRKLFSAHILLGQIELRSGNFQQAQHHLELARSLRSDSPIPLLHLGDLSYLQKDVKKAEEFYREAIKLKRQYSQAYIQLSRLYMAQDNHAAALDILKKALSIKPDDYSLLVSLGNLSFFQEDMDSAIYYFSRAAKIQSAKPTNYFNLGECYARKGDTARARTYFLRFLELAPDDEFHDPREAVKKWLKKH